VNNEPAFPALPISRELNGELVYQSKGLTIRDYFAAKAMMSLYLSGLEWEPTGKPRDPEHMTILEELAVDAYQFADAMLEARNGNS
jgi:hypothetical protein